MEYKTNITKKELENALNYFKENNIDVGTIELKSNPIGSIILISKDYDSEQTNITNYDSW